MAALMGVSIGFLAFLVIGGISGVSTWIFYPRPSQGFRPGKIALTFFLGFIAAASSSLLGQYWEFFQSGQMLEWVSAIFAACTVACVFTALTK